jgi:hypothetical protein
MATNVVTPVLTLPYSPAYDPRIALVVLCSEAPTDGANSAPFTQLLPLNDVNDSLWMEQGTWEDAEWR